MRGFPFANAPDAAAKELPGSAVITDHGTVHSIACDGHRQHVVVDLANSQNRFCQ
jgi:hypothetical protein